jgi:hypothetical protein
MLQYRALPMPRKMPTSMVVRIHHYSLLSAAVAELMLRCDRLAQAELARRGSCRHHRIFESGIACRQFIHLWRCP